MELTPDLPASRSQCAALRRLACSGHDRLTRWSFALSCVALCGIAVAYLVEVVARYAFNSPTRWSSDAVQYMLCAGTALAFPIVTREGGHVAITSFVEKLPSQIHARLMRAIQLLGAAALGATAAVFVDVGWDQARQNIETVASLAIPKWWLSALLAFGSAMSAVHLLRQGLDPRGHSVVGHEMDV